MKLQRRFICIAGAFVAVGFATSQAGAKTPLGCGTAGGPGFGFMEIEVNALRAGARFIQAGANQTRDVTAKARILKGTAQPGTIIATTLTIEALDGADVISENSTGPITLGVGKGGKGAKLTMDIPSCNSGFIVFVARFWGTDVEGDPCEGKRSLRKDCR